MTYEEIVAYTKNRMADVDVKDYKGHLAVQVNITGEGEGAFYVELNDGTYAVEPYEYFDRDAVLTASADAFLAIADGRKDAVAAYLTGQLKVEGSLDKAKEFAGVLKNTKKKTVKKAATKTSAKTAKATAKPAAKATAKAAAKKTVAKKTEEKPAAVKKEVAAKPTATVKKAAVATAKKVVAKKATTKSAETK